MINPQSPFKTNFNIIMNEKKKIKINNNLIILNYKKKRIIDEYLSINKFKGKNINIFFEIFYLFFSYLQQF